jgi:CRP-like cAMP-binding protein
MILPAARLWFEGKSKDLEEVLKEAEQFRLTGYARCAFEGGAQAFMALRQGSLREILEIAPGNKAVARSLKDLWGRSKIKAGLLQVFQIPAEAEWFLSRLAGRRQIIASGTGPADLRRLVLGARSMKGAVAADVQTAEGKGLILVENGAVTQCWYTENDGFTQTDLEAFRRMASAVSPTQPFRAWISAVAETPPPATPWLPLLLTTVSFGATPAEFKARLAEKYGSPHGPGTILFREGDEGEEFYLVISGRVAIYKDKGGRRKILAELGPGDFFGEMAIFNRAPRAATAETVENSLLIRIGREQLHTLLYNSYEFRLGMIKRLARRLRDTVDEMARLWEDPRAVYLERIIFQILNSDQKWQDEGIPPGLLMREISGSSGMRFSEIDAVFRKLLDTGKIDFIRGKVVMKDLLSLP